MIPISYSFKFWRKLRLRPGSRFRSKPTRIKALPIGIVALFIYPVLAADGDVFDDWIMRCDPASETPRCYLSQRAFIQGSGERVFELAVGQLGKNKQVVMLLTAPLGIYLPAGLRVQVDNTTTQRVALLRCNARGCHAELLLNDEFLDLMKKGLQLNITFSDSALQQFGFSMSLKGFSSGLRQLLAP